MTIEKAILAGESKQAIASLHGVSRSSLDRHMKNHLSRQLIQADKRRQELTGESLLQEIQELIKRLKKLLKKAEREKEYSSAIAAAGQLRNFYEFLTKLGLYQKETQDQKTKVREQADKLKILSRRDLKELKRLYVKAGIAEDDGYEPAPRKTFDDDFIDLDLEDFTVSPKRRKRIRKSTV
jgi:hypothetical protein